MRELNIGTKKHTTVVCLDEAGQDGACYKYQIIQSIPNNEKYFGNTEYIEPDVFTSISFQNGAVKEYGVNGCHNEDLIAVVIDRLQGFQKGDFKCRENAIALTKLEEALMWLRKRTQDRENRGVEGTSNV